MKNYLLRIICFICFVIMPVIVMLNTPVLKQFYCSKSKDACLVRVYNMFQQNPNFKDDFKISDIEEINSDKCNSLFGLYKENCVAIKTKNNITHYLEFSFNEDADAHETADDIKIFLKNNGKAYQEYKLIAQKDEDGLNTITIGWGVIILFGLLISFGFVKGTTDSGKGLSYAEQFKNMLKFFEFNNLKTLPRRFVDWFRIRVIEKWFYKSK